MKKELLEKINSIGGIIKTTIEILSALGFLSIIYGTIVRLAGKTNDVLFPFIINHIIEIWLSTITLVLILICFMLYRLNIKFFNTFRDDFKKDLKEWDYIGSWKIFDTSLVVTGSDEGGITKNGILWENYTLSFKAKIENHCIAVIIRAQDLNNYYMLQITNQKIRPHRRVAVPIVSTQPNQSSPTISYSVGWQIFEDKSSDHHTKLDDWFDVDVIVKQQSIILFINKQKVFEDESLIQIPFGRIGFRNHSDEKAFIKKVRVKLN